MSSEIVLKQVSINYWKIALKNALSSKFFRVTILILILSIPVSLAYRYLSSFQSNKPVNVTISNISSNSATISWVTDKPQPGVVQVSSTDGNSWIPMLRKDAQFGYDDRDYARTELAIANEVSRQAAENRGVRDLTYSDIMTELRVVEKGLYFLHHVTVRDLQPDTDYFFAVGDGVTFVQVNDVKSFKTSDLPDNLGVPNPTYGRITSWIDRNEGIDDGVVYMTVVDPVTGFRSELQSSTLNENGSWYIDLSNIRTAEGKLLSEQFTPSEFDALLEELQIELGPRGLYGKTITTLEDAPAKPISIGNPNDEIVPKQFTVGGDSLSFIKNVLSSSVVIAAKDAPACASGDSGETYGECCGGGLAKEIRRCTHSGTGTYYFHAGGCVHSAPHCNVVIDTVCNNNGIRDCQGYSPGKCEDGVDCGNSLCGPCSAAPNNGIPDHCSNGVRDQGLEEGVDCGAACPTCQGVPSQVNHLSTVCPPAGCVPPQEPAPGGGNPPPVSTAPLCCFPDGVPELAGTYPSTNGSCQSGHTLLKAGECNALTTNGLCCRSTFDQQKWFESATSCPGSHTIRRSDISSKEVCERIESNNAAIDCTRAPDGSSCSTTSSGNSVDGRCQGNVCVVDTPTTCPDNRKDINGNCNAACCGAGATCGSGQTCVDGSNGACASGNSCQIPPGSTAQCQQPTDCVGIGSNCVSNRCVYASGHPVTIPAEPVSGSCNQANLGTYVQGFCDKEVCNASCSLACESATYRNMNYWKCNVTGSDICNVGARGIQEGKVCNPSSCPSGYTYERKVSAGGMGVSSRYYYQCIPPATPTPTPDPSLRPPSNVGRSYDSMTQCEAACVDTEHWKRKCTYIEDDGTNVCFYYRNSSSFIFKSSFSDLVARVSNLLTKSVSAQAVKSDTILYSPEQGAYLFEESGVYQFVYDGQTYEVELENSDGAYIIYIDMNNNNVYDSAIDITITTDPAELSIEKVAEVNRYAIKGGFNFISFDFIPDRYSLMASSFLDELNTDYDGAFYSLARFHSGKWQIVGWNDGRSYGSEDFQIAPGVGYLLRSKRDVSLDLTGYTVNSVVPLYLRSGWNLVGIHGTASTYTAESLLDSINSQNDLEADNITRWNSSIARYEGLQKSPDDSGVVQLYGFDFPIFSQSSYFIRVLQGEGRWNP